MAASDINDYVFYKIVCIDEDLDLAYVGSTRDLYKRKDKHKRCCTEPNHSDYNQKKYQIIRANGGWDNFKLIEIGKREQITKRQAEHIEEEYRVNLRANMNGYRCYVSEDQAKELKKQADKDYNQNNKEKIKKHKKTKMICECGCEITIQSKSQHIKSKMHIDLLNNEYKEPYAGTEKEYQKEYREKNKEEIKEKRKEFYETNKEEISEKAKVKVMCECGCEVRRWDIARHRKSKKHLDLMKINNE